MDRKEEVNKFLNEINGMNDAEQIEYYIKFYNDRKANNRKILLEMALIKQAIQDGKIPMPTDENRKNICDDLKKMKVELLDIENTLKELYEIKQLNQELI